MKTRLGNSWNNKLKKDVIVARLMIVVMLIYFVLPLLPADIFASTQVKTLVVTVDKIEGLVGETFEFEVKYSYSSTDNALSGENIVAQLPTDMVISDYSITNHIVDLDKDGDSNTNFVNGSTITFPVVDTVGATGVLSFSAYYPIGKVNSDTEVAIIVTGGDHDPTVNNVDGERNDPVVTVKLKTIEADDLSVTKTLGSPYNGSFNPVPGSTITYNIKAYGVSGLGAYNLNNTTVVDNLPTQATYVSSTNSGSYSAENHTVTWDVEDLMAGTTFSASVTVKYEQEDVSTIEGNENNSVTNSVTATAETITGADEETMLTDTASVAVSFDEATPGIKGISKRARNEAADSSGAAAEYSINETIRYTISGFGNNGNVALDTMIVYDELPNEILVNSITASGATVYYATESFVVPTDNRDAVAAIVAISDDKAALAAEAVDASNTATDVADTAADLATAKETDADNAEAAAVTARETADTAEAQDPQDPELIAAAQEAADIAEAAAITARDEATSARTNANDKATLASDAATAATEATNIATAAAEAAAEAIAAGEAEALEAAAPEYSKYTWIPYDSETYADGVALKFVYEDVVVGDTLDTITINANYIESAINLGDTYLNTAYVVGYAEEYNYDSSNTTVSNKAYIKYVDELPIITFAKEASVEQIKDNERLSYTLTFKNATNATGDVSEADVFTVADTLPLDASNQPIFTDLIVESQNGLTVEINDSGSYQNVTDSNYVHTVGVGITKLDFNLTNITIPRGDSVSITYSVLVKKGTVVKSYINSADGTYTDADEGGKIGPKTNHDNLLNKDESIFVKFTGSLNSVKGVGYNIYSNPEHTEYLGADLSTLIEDKDGEVLVAGTDYTNSGSADGSFALPIGSSIVNVTLPGGVVRYRLQVSNDEANGPISNIVLIDKLPKKLDTGVIVNADRNSGWSPYLASEIVISNSEGIINDPDKFKVFYTTVAEPDYSQLYDPKETETTDHGDWTLDPPNNITDVTHIKIQITETFAPNDKVIVEWDMKAPYDVPELLDEADPTSRNIAWNSFAYAATFDGKDGLDRFLPAEPIKVGVRIDNSSPVGLDGAIGNFIWHDANMNGLQDDDEVGINDIPVKLYYSADESFDFSNDDNDSSKLLDTTYTGPNNADEPGYYYFPNLGIGHYVVQFEMPEGFYITTIGNEPSDNPLDSDFYKVPDSIIHRNEPVELGIVDTDAEINVVETNTNIDAGIYRKVSLGDYVWDDLSYDGIQDDNEPAVSGVKVILFKDDVSQSFTHTNALGYYEFTELDPAADYSVQFDLRDTDNNAELVHYSFTKANEGLGDDQDELDSDGAITIDNTSIAETSIISLDSNIGKDEAGNYLDLASGYLTDASIDQGIRKGVIGNFVWNDQDVDGIQEIGEQALVSITAKLYKDDGSGIYLPVVDPSNPEQNYEIITGEDGEYLFTRLDNGTYKVEFDLPNGSSLRPTKLNETRVDDTPDDTVDSDGDLTNYTTGMITIFGGTEDLTNDMGFYYQGTIGNFIWEDMNGNGIQDTYDHDDDPDSASIDEPGISDVSIELLYDNNDEDTDLNNSYSYADHMLAYQANLNPMTTDENGLYMFDDLYFDTYKLIVTKPNGYDMFTIQNIGDDGLDSDANSETGDIGNATIGESNYVDNTHDAGFYKYASLGDYVWIDTNMDGIQDDDEVGMDGVLVTLSGTRMASYSTTTATFEGKAGYYSFTNLAPDTYTLTFTLPDNYSVSPENQGEDDTKDSDGEANSVRDTTATISNIVLYSDEDDMSNDLGIYPSFSLGDLVWEDMTNDGLQTNEASNGINGVKLALYTSLGARITDTLTTTIDGVDGSYKFDDLPLGSYYVVVEDSITVNIDTDYEIALYTPDENDTVNNDAQANNNKTDTVTFIANPALDKHNPTLDIGMYEYSSIGDLVWEDLNYDGLQNDGATGIEGTVVRLYKDLSDVVYATTNTDANGNYSFDSVEPGTYDLEFVIPRNYTATDSDQGGDDKLDSDGTIDTFVDTTSRVENIVVTSGFEDLDFDLGVYKSFSIGNKTWLDKDGNGLQDESEVVSGIILKLYKFNGENQTIDDAYLISAKNSANLVATSVTSAANGSYIFQDLPKGKYFVVANTVTYKMTTLNVGDNNTLDSNFIKEAFIENYYKTQSLDPYLFDNSTADNARYNETVDAGFFELAGLGNRVWDDTNYNGLQDDGELGISGVTVDLYKYGSGDVLATKTTNESGEYLFTNLDPARYTLKFTYSDDYFVTYKDRTTDEENIVSEDVDSDGTKVDGQSQAIIEYNQLYSGESITNLDLGLYKEASVGNYVWKDLNRDGIQNNSDGEGFFGALNVEIFNADGSNPYGVNSPLSKDSTDETGSYGFTSLKPGDYKLVFSLPDDYSITTQNAASTTDDLDSDIEADMAMDTEGSISFTLTSGEENLDIDLGIHSSFKLGNFVFDDMNGDGIQDDGEPGISDVTIYLYEAGANSSLVDSHIASTTTNVNGVYEFSDLSMGSYFVKVVPKESYVITENEATVDEEKDSDIDEATGVSETVTFNKDSAAIDNSLDAGMYIPATLGDYVWLDENKNGIQDGETTGVEDVDVYLYKSGVEPSDNNHVAMTTTDGDGAYSFTELKPDSYFVVFKNFPTDEVIYAVSPLNNGSSDQDSDGNVNSSALHLSATTADTTLTSGETEDSIDLGLYPGFSIGDTVWYDENANGLYDGLESGIEDITLHLYRQDGETPDVSTDTEVNTDITDINGEYLFKGLPMGTYYVKIVISNLHFLSEKGVGDDVSIDSNFDKTLYTSDVVIFNDETDDSSDLDVDAGLYKQVGIGDKVWVDSDYNGLLNGDEAGLINVNVHLYQGENLLTSTTTNNEGIYSFAGLVPGTYRVEIDIPEAYNLTKKTIGNDRLVDSNGIAVNSSRAKSEEITLSADETNNSIDFGIYQYATLGNFVFEDLNRDGEYDNILEAGITGVKVELVRVVDSLVVDTKTTLNGEYLFENINPDDYQVRFSNFPDGYTVTIADNAADDVDSDGLNSDSVTTTTSYSTTDTITMSSNEIDETVDLGLYPNFSIGNYVWKDSNADGIQDVNEEVKEGMVMYLYQNGKIPGLDAHLATDTTDDNGEYLFDNLSIGQYFVYAEVDEYLVSDLNQGNGDNDSDFDTESYQSGIVTFTANTSDLESYNESVDLGVYKLAGLGNRVWVDKNANGIQDAGETNFPGIAVRLLDSEGGELATTTTSAEGIYFFDSLEPGIYNIEFTLPNDTYHVTKFEQGSNIELDSNGVLVDGKVLIQNYELYESESINSLDIGLYQLGSIGDYVWYDANKDGIQDVEELPVTTGMNVEISGEGITRSMVTDENGEYLFEDLVPGDYTIRFTKISKYRMSPSNNGANDSIDSDANSGGVVEDVELTSGQAVTYVDAGIYYSPTPVAVVTPTPTPEATAIPEVTPEATVEPTPTPVATATPQATLAPNPTPGPPQPPVIKELKPETPTVDLPEEEKPKERIFIIDEEVDEVTIVKEPDHGSVVVDEGNNIIYTPSETFDGSDSIVVLIEDGDDDFLMEIDIFEEDIAEAQLAELPATGGVPTTIYYLLGSILAMTGVLFKKK